MVRRCQNCPGIDGLLGKLMEMFSDMDDEEPIHFQQWQSTDRTQIMTLFLSRFEFLQLPAEKLDHLSAHSYIAKAQTAYLRHSKETSKTNECLILADFAENYHFIVEDEIQSCHWSKELCTLHLVVIYALCNNTLQSFSYCFISNDMKHDTVFVYYLQSVLSENIKVSFPHLNYIEYFSDGCAAQYKNFKNLHNLSFHQSDFGFEACWLFFATSHEKSPCGGIGGVVKRKLANASLGRSRNNRILTAKDAFLYCRKNITGITFFYNYVAEN